MFLSVLFSVLSGVTIVLSRTVNGRLSEKTSPLGGTFWNYCAGLCVSLLLLPLLGRGEPSLLSVSGIPLFAFAGGLFGVATVTLMNLCVPHIASFYMTLMLFTGQVFCALVIDYVRTGSISLGQLVGGALVLLGLFVNLMTDRRFSPEQRLPNRR